MKRKTNRRTWTSQLLELLEGRDDFMSTPQIRGLLGCNENQLSATLIHLRRRHAIDVVIEKDGTAWWIATPEQDDRTRALKFRAEECEGNRRPRKPKVKKVQP